MPVALAARVRLGPVLALSLGAAACVLPPAERVGLAEDPVGVGGSGDAGTPSGPCAALRGPSMVLVPDSFCIDTTEVTNAQYVEFLEDADAIVDGEAFCAHNASYHPAIPPTPATDHHPVAGVDWCDASAFCRWAGKHLCGHPAGGPAPYSESTVDATTDAWFHACSLGGGQGYPYATTYAGGRCNDDSFGAGATVPAASASGCEGPLSGLFDLAGNVAEWVDGCDGVTGAADRCIARGGSFASELAGCTDGSLVDRDHLSADIGFRCCKAPAS